MRFSEETRVLVFFLFFVALTMIAILYTPTNALSRPASAQDKKALSVPLPDSLGRATGVG